MPDRRAEREQDPRIAPQQCAVCLQPFCHLYWGCARVGCLGCLAPFCELDLGDRCLDGVLSNNHYESDVLKNYLATRGLTWKNMLTESLVALQRGAFLLSGKHRGTCFPLCRGGAFDSVTQWNLPGGARAAPVRLPSHTHSLALRPA